MYDIYNLIIIRDYFSFSFSFYFRFIFILFWFCIFIFSKTKDVNYAVYAPFPLNVNIVYPEIVERV